jgi:hypothetical protein
MIDSMHKSKMTARTFTRPSTQTSRAPWRKTSKPRTQLPDHSGLECSRRRAGRASAGVSDEPQYTTSYGGRSMQQNSLGRIAKVKHWCREVASVAGQEREDGLEAGRELESSR